MALGCTRWIGRRFLDFGAGIATSSLGHDHPHLTAAIAEQAHKVMHVSNLYRVPQAERLAARLVAATFADSVFFCNSGAEANEGMVKMIRRAQYDNGHPERYRVICFEGAFHGRTLAMLAATGNSKYLKGFGPEVDGFDHVPFNNLNALRDAIRPQTAGIMIEPVQGEGGIRPAYLQFLRDLRATCDEFGIFLGMDEIQCGMGRSGKLFAHEWAGITPDVLTAAKGIAGGFPMGAILATENVAKHLTAGSHGTTFGGNPLACAAANAVLDVLLAPGFLADVDRRAPRAVAWAGAACRRRAGGVRGRARAPGCCSGLKCAVPNTEVQQAFMAEGLLSVGAGDNVVRLAPPLIVSRRRHRRGAGDDAARCAPLHPLGRTNGGEVSGGALRRAAAGGRTSQDGAPVAPRHFLDLRDFDTATLRHMLDIAAGFKAAGGVTTRPLAGKTVALIFEKPSTRTRVSFEVGVRQLGGDVVVLSGKDTQLGRGETVADTARVLSRYVDAIMLRTDAHDKLLEMAAHATVPVINGLTAASHPCQLMADVLTFEEHRGPIAGQVVAWCGDGNNVARSWIEAAARFGFTLRLATPDELRPPVDVVAWARAQGATIELTDDAVAAVAGARCVVTDTWVSMSDDRVHQSPQSAGAVPGDRGADGQGRAGRGVHALPAGASRRGGDGRRHRRPAIGGVRRGGEPAARAEGCAGLGAGGNEMSV